MNSLTSGTVGSGSIAALSAVLVMALSLSAHAAVLCVSASGKVPASTAKNLGCTGPVFTKIGKAVAAASTGTTVAVFPGTYDEMVTITLANLQLVGMNPKKTIIDATGQPNGVLAMASGVGISGFTIENASHEGILVTGPPATCQTNASGQFVDCSPSAPPLTGVTVSNNIVTDNDKELNISTSPPTCAGAPDFESEDCGEAIHLDGVDFSTVDSNSVKHNAGGILLTDETNENKGNLVTGNDVEENTPDCGITLPSHPPNGVIGTIGLRSFGVSQNTVANNTSKSNGAAGVGVFTPTPGTRSTNNLIVGNMLTNNVLPGVTFHRHGMHQNLDGNRVISNTISGNGADPDPGPNESDGPTASTGIEVYADVTADPIDVDIAGNTISKETNSIWVGSLAWNNCSDTTPCYTPLVHLNNLLKGTFGVQTGTASAIQVVAPENFWGCSKGPGQKGCTATSGNVTSTPFLSKSSKLP